jgi:hypothetical protein
MMALCIVLIYGSIVSHCELRWVPAQSSNMDAAASIIVPQELTGK